MDDVDSACYVIVEWQWIKGMTIPATDVLTHAGQLSGNTRLSKQSHARLISDDIPRAAMETTLYLLTEILGVLPSPWLVLPHRIVRVGCQQSRL
jgi:hypothetical protein